MDIRSTWTRRFLVWCGTFLVGFGATTASAQPALPSVTGLGAPAPSSDTKYSTTDLNERLLRLEKQNEELLQRLETISGSATQDKKADPAKPAGEKDKDKSYVVGKSLKMEASWKHGVWVETPDKAFRFYVGGVIQDDICFLGADQAIVNSLGSFNNLVDPGQSLTDGMTLRRARLRLAGTLYEQFEFFSQYDFASSLDLRRRSLGIGATAPTPTAYDLDPADATLFNEVYVGLTKLPFLGEVRVGRHRESLNFITATSDTNQVWLERGLMFDAFNGDYNFSNGITLSNSYFEDRAYTLFGFFQQNNPNRTFSSVGDGDYVYDARFTFLPIWNEECEQWVHVGFDYSYRNLHNEQVRYRARPMVRSGTSFQVPNVVSTGTIFSPDAQQVANLEFAASLGRWTIAAEGACSWVSNSFTGGLPNPDGTLPTGVKSRGTYFAEGGYAEVLYFLTPDHRLYRKERPGYDRVIPKRNVFFLDGEHGRVWSLGAWEVGARYDYVDLTNSGINGGTAQAVTLALNWYFHPNFRIQHNVFWMHRDFDPGDDTSRVNGDLYGLGIRFNCDF